MSKLLNVSSSPHVRSNETTQSIMVDVAIAMLPATAFGVFQFGLHALLVLIVTIAACVLSEYVFEKRIAAIEGVVAELAVASGAAAVTYTILNLAQNGTILFQPKIYMVVHLILLENTLLKYGIETNFVAIFNEEEIESAINEKTKALYIETLGNPNSDVVDIESITKIAHKHKIPLVVDNTFAS